MLPDVGMVTYPECLWNMMPQNVHLGWWAWNGTPPCSWMPQNVHLGWWPLLVPGVFPPVGFSMQAHMFFRDTWHHPYISSCFVGNVFTPLVSLLFLECKLHCGTCALHWKQGQRLCWQLYSICPLMLCIIFSCVYCYYYVNLGCWAWNGTPPWSWSFSTSWFFHAGTCVLWRHLAPSLHLYLFLWKTFLLPLLLSMECKLHSGNLSLEALEVMQTKTGQWCKLHAALH